MIRSRVSAFAFIALLLVTTVVATESTAFGLSCVQLTPEEMVEKAEAVALARVTHATEPDGLRPEVAKPVVLEVERVFKGDLGKRIVVMHTWLVGPDIRLEVGERYLLFLNRRADGSRRTSLCSGSRAMPGDLPLALAAVLGEGQPPSGVDDPLPVREKASPMPKWVWGGSLLLLGVGLAWFWSRR